MCPPNLKNSVYYWTDLVENKRLKCRLEFAQLKCMQSKYR